jgi:hypothetical protein
LANNIIKIFFKKNKCVYIYNDVKRAVWEMYTEFGCETGIKWNIEKLQLNMGNGQLS